MATSSAIREEYMSSLADLEQNSKPMIDMLTMLAEDHRQHAQIIVDAIKQRISQVRQKLPLLYLIDSIVKNVGDEYKHLFQQEIVGIFVEVFDKSKNDKVREKMFALRETWNEVFLPTKLYMMDVKVNQIDPNWPIVAKVTKNPKIHVNPNFLKKPIIEPVVESIEQLKQEVLEKQRKLLELQKCKLELEMREATKKIEEEERKRAAEASATTVMATTSTAPASFSAKSVKMASNSAAGKSVRSGGTGAGAVGKEKKDNKSSPTNRKSTSSSSSTSPKSSSKSKNSSSHRSSSASSSHHHHSGSSGNKDKKRSSKRSSDESKSSPTKRSRSSGSEDGDKKAKHAAVMMRRIPKLSASQSQQQLPPVVGDTDDRIGVAVTSPLKVSDSLSGTGTATGAASSATTNQKLFLGGAAMDVDLRQFVAMPTTSTATIVENKIEMAKGDMDERALAKNKHEQQQHSNTLGTDGHGDEDDRDEDQDQRDSENETAPFAKKTKSEKFDILFGSNDVDLRSNSQNINSSQMAGEKDGWSRIKGDTPRRGPAPKTNFEAIKSRIQEASKAKKKRFDERIIDRQPQLLDVDLRTGVGDTAQAALKSPRDTDDTSQDALDSSIKIIMTQAQEQLDNRTITVDQYQNMVQQVIQLNETKKIREVERLEKRNGGGGAAEDDDRSTSDSDSEDEYRDYRRKKADRKSRFQNRYPDNNTPQGGVVGSAPPPFGGANGQRMDGMHRKPWENNHNNNRNPMGMPRPPGNWRGMPPFAGNRTPWLNGPIPGPGGRFMGGPPRFNNRPPPFGPPPPHLQPPMLNNQPPLLQMGNQVRNSREAPSTIKIDNVNREIRFYDETAVVFMDWDQPMEIGFQPGTRRISCDEKWSMNLAFNAPFVTWMIEGRPHKVRLGAPTRELYIDNEWYECYIGDPCRLELDGKVRTLMIDGPPPQVRIGVARRDLVAGKISIIIDAKVMVPVYLDAREQQFEVDGIVHTLQFADYFLTVLINKEPVSVEFGGLPKSFFVNGQKHFMRFTALPANVVPGQFTVLDMLRTQEHRHVPSPPIPPSTLLLPPPAMHNVMMSHPPPSMMQLPPPLTIPPPIAGASLSNGLDMLTNILPGLASPQIPMLGKEPPQQTLGYNLENNGQSTKASSDGPSAANPLGNVNVNDLFQKLLATGILPKGNDSPTAQKAVEDKNNGENKQQKNNANHINNNNNRRGNRGGDGVSNTKEVGSSTKAAEKAPKAQEMAPLLTKDKIIPVDLGRPASIKSRQLAIVQQVYLGMQCSSCGVRFPPEQTMKYSQHLDWHFRQNRRDRDSVRKAHSRKWFYDVNNWIQYEEIEDLEEREKNWFETQQSEDMTQDDANTHGDGVMPSCPAGPIEGEKICEVCHEPFDQFYHEETEEWHLRPAVRMEERIYHPICYEDYKMSLTMNESRLSESQEGEDGAAAVKLERVKKEEENGDEGDEKDRTMDQSTDNDDDVIVLPMDAPSITEILDDDEEEAAMATTSAEAVNRSPRVDDENDKDSNGEVSMDVLGDSSKITMPKPGVVHIKAEPKDDGYNEEDAFMDVGTIEPNDEDETMNEEEARQLNEEHEVSNAAMERDNDDESRAEEDPPRQTATTVEPQDEETILTVDTSEGNRESPETIALDSPVTPAFQQLGLDVDVERPVVSIVPNRIKININKLASASVQAEGNTDSRDSVNSGYGGLVPPGTETFIEEVKRSPRPVTPEAEIEYEMKETMKEAHFQKMVPVANGIETSGLCSIM